MMSSFSQIIRDHLEWLKLNEENVSLSIYSSTNMRKKFLILFFILTSFVLAACGSTSASWPGITARGNVVYVAYGPSVAAFDVVAGKQLWSFPTEPNQATLFYASPSVKDEHIVVGDYGTASGFFGSSKEFVLYGLEDNGENIPTILWSNNELLQDRLVASPLQVNGSVYVGTADNVLLALDAKTGTEKWRQETGNSIWAQPLFRDGVVYVVSLDKKLYAFEAETGDLLWDIQFAGSMISQPAIGEALLYAGTFDNKVHAVDLNTGEEKWVIETEGWVWSSPVIDDNALYIADLEGNIYAIDASTGTELWTKQNSGLGTVQATPVVSDGKIIFSGGDKTTDKDQQQGTLLALATADGTELWRQRTSVPVYSTPVIVGDQLVVALNSTQGLLFLYNLETGQQQGEPLAPPAAEE